MGLKADMNPFTTWMCNEAEAVKFYWIKFFMNIFSRDENIFN